jgi:hypothetical protein
MASGVYNYFKAHILDAEYDLGNGGDTVKCALLDNSHSFTAENDGWADVSANEISGTGYTTGGATLANQAVSIDDTDDEGVFDADDVSWTSASFTAYHAVVYDDTHASDALICSIDFGGAQTVTSGTFTIQWDSEGILNIT